MSDWRNPEKTPSPTQIVKPEPNIRLASRPTKRKNKSHWLKKTFLSSAFLALGIFSGWGSCNRHVGLISDSLPSPDGALKTQVTLSTKNLRLHCKPCFMTLWQYQKNGD